MRGYIFYGKDAGSMYILAGLGNPEARYAGTRHNIGFDAIDIIADAYKIKLKKIKHKAVFGDGTIGGEKVLLSKPQTYMNLSGESIRDMAAFYKISPEQIIIFNDDISLAPGRVRIRPKGSDGGHNGLKSIIYQLQSDAFVRVRIGVGAPPHADYDLADYVLGRYTPEDIEALKPLMQSMPDIADCLVTQGVQAAMNRYNGK